MTGAHWHARAWWLLLIVCVLWTAGIVLPPFLHEAGQDNEAFLLRWCYGPVCHQDVQRSQALFGFPFSVCHRCAAIYFGFTAMLLIYPALRRSGFARAMDLKRLAIALLPVALDYGLDVVGVWHNGALSRSITGAVTGVALALYIMPPYMEAWFQLFGGIPATTRIEAT